MTIVRLIWYILKLVLFWLLGLVFFVVAAVVRIFDLWTAVRIFQQYLRSFFRLFGLNVRYTFEHDGTRHAKNTVFVLLNQSSFLDSLITPAIPVRRTRGILNIEMAFYPIIGWFLAISNFVIVRQWPAQAKATLNRTDKFLRSGGNMIISIEGKRSRDGRLNAYKKGPVVMAINSGSDIVPMIIEGAYGSLPYGSLYAKPGNVQVRLLAPISTKEMTYEDRDQLKEQLLSIAHSNGLH